MKRLLVMLGAFFALAALTIGVAGPAAAKSYQTRDGHTIVLDANLIEATGVAPLDSSPLSREAMLHSDIHTAVQGIKPGESVSATLDVGYQIGYPVSVAPTGIKVTAHTPELKLSAGLNAKIAPTVTISGSGGGGSLGEIGGEIGAEATIIPAADLEFEVGAGKITTVSLATIALTKPTADIVLSGVELNATNALGAVSVRPYAKISATTDTGVYVYIVYGKTVQL